MSSDGVTFHPPAKELPFDGTSLPAHARNLRLENAAHQFEASLMQELFAPLQKDSMSSHEEGDEESGNALATFASEAMARAVSDRGGFGIARQLIDHFEKPSQNRPRTS